MMMYRNGQRCLYLSYIGLSKARTRYVSSSHLYTHSDYYKLFVVDNKGAAPPKFPCTHTEYSFSCVG